MQPLGLGNRYDDYIARIFSSHDFRIEVDVLDLNEHHVGEASFLDGQVNLQKADGVRRTCSLTLSDPEGVLDFTGASEWSGSSVWVDRLIRVRHVVNVPSVGDVAATVFIGPPSTFARQDAQVNVELQDKSALALRGSTPVTVNKGMVASDAIVQILSQCTGEFRFRVPSFTRRLSRPYSVGWDDASSPWTVASRIARHELGCQLIYSCDGYATLRRLPSRPILATTTVTSEPNTTVDFTTLSNWVRVRGKQTTTSKSPGSSTVTTTTQPESIARVKPGRTFSPESLARKGVPRFLPLLVDDDAITKVSEARTRAQQQLDKSDRLEQAPTFECVPFFHADVDDLVRLTLPGQDAVVRLGDVSIPLGVGGEMSIGAHRWVSHPPGSKVTGHIRHTKKVTHRKTTKKAGKK